MTSQEWMLRAQRDHWVIPAFNVPYLPMMEPIVQALRDTEAVGFVAVARLEWMKFSSGSLRAVREEYLRVGDARYTRLHLDHVPVIDEDQKRVSYADDIKEAIALGFSSVMVDGSRLPLEENIAATREVVLLAHAAGIPAEAELGAVFGHESGPLPPYEDLFASGKGFTDPGEARRFVAETGVDWLSVAIGNIHGAIAGAAKAEKKPATRLSIDHLRAIAGVTGVPLVLHGGSGIRKESILAGVRHGIAKINVGAAIRLAYEAKRAQSIAAAQKAVYQATVQILTDELEVAGSARRLNPAT
jgi:ketose-bisphosphate aldolase